MEDLLKEYTVNHHVSDDIVGIARDDYKRNAFQETLSFKFENEGLMYSEKFVRQSFEFLETIIDNPKLIISSLPIAKYKNHVYAITDKHTIVEITNYIEKGGEVIVYSSVPENGGISYVSTLI